MTTYEAISAKKEHICVVGLGYVGLPLAAAFSKRFSVVGFDINKNRVNELRNGIDSTHEISHADLSRSPIRYTTDPQDISACGIIIVTVPTPVDDHKNPDLGPVCSSTRVIGSQMKKGAVVVYESTVYPGLTEEICVPILEKESGFVWKKDFHVGYSPERINPSDRAHTVETITKVVAGDTPAVCDLLAAVYGSVVKAGIHKAPTIKTAEAAKVIENTQRDLNIALVNELAMIFNRAGIDTKAVLEAAATKWNFLRFEPGLVGGHCIGVDPYYLTFKAESLGYHPQVILAGRRINDSMGQYVAQNTVKKLIQAGKSVKGCRCLILGFTFKENITDIRNTKVIDIQRELAEFGVDARVYDPHVNKADVREEYGIECLDVPADYSPYDAVVFAVRHDTLVSEFTLERLKDISSPEKPVLIDVKSHFSPDAAAKTGFTYWRL